MTVETHLFINWCDYAVISATERTKLKGILSRSQGLVIMKKGTGRGNLPENFPKNAKINNLEC